MKRKKWAKQTFVLPSEYWGWIMKSKDIQHRLLNPLTLLLPHLLTNVPINHKKVFAVT